MSASRWSGEIGSNQRRDVSMAMTVRFWASAPAAPSKVLAIVGRRDGLRQCLHRGAWRQDVLKQQRGHANDLFGDVSLLHSTSRL